MSQVEILDMSTLSHPKSFYHSIVMVGKEGCSDCERAKEPFGRFAQANSVIYCAAIDGSNPENNSAIKEFYLGEDDLRIAFPYFIFGLKPVDFETGKYFDYEGVVPLEEPRGDIAELLRKEAARTFGKAVEISRLPFEMRTIDIFNYNSQRYILDWNPARVQRDRVYMVQPWLNKGEALDDDSKEKIEERIDTLFSKKIRSLILDFSFVHKYQNIDVCDGLVYSAIEKAKAGQHNIGMITKKPEFESLLKYTDINYSRLLRFDSTDKDAVEKLIFGFRA